MVENSVETGATLENTGNLKAQSSERHVRMLTHSSHPVTPSNPSQSVTDQDEIYDSVRSLSLAQDDSLIYKREQAVRKVQARLSQDFDDQDDLEDDGEEYSSPNVDDDEGEHTSVQEDAYSEAEETTKNPKSGRISALQMMLQQSENFIKRQESTNSREEHKGEEQYADYGLPAVQAQLSSQLDDTDEEMTEMIRQDNMNFNSVKYQPSISDDSSMSPQNQSSRRHNPYGTPQMEDENSLESVQVVSEQSFDQFRASNMQDEDVYNNSTSQISSRNNQTLLTTPQRQNLETETVTVESLSIKQNGSDLTVQKNPSFVTMVPNHEGVNGGRSSKSASVNNGLALTGKMPTDSLNDISPEEMIDQESQGNDDGHPTDNSFDESSYATPVVGAEADTSPRQKLEQTAQEVLVVNTNSPASFHLDQSHVREDSVLVHDEVTNENAIKTAALNELVFGMRGQNNDLYQTDFQMEEGTLTIRQSLDNTGCEDVIAEFHSGPRRLISSDSGSRDDSSSHPNQVSAAMHPSLDNNSQQSPSLMEHREDNSLRSESIKVLHFEHSDNADSLVDLGIDREDDSCCPQTDSKLFLTDNKSRFNQLGSNSEAKMCSAGTQRLILNNQHIGCSSFNQTSSLRSSLKKKSDSTGLNSEVRSRTFIDVLNAMRDTEEIEEEKRQIMMQERNLATMEVQLQYSGQKASLIVPEITSDSQEDDFKSYSEVIVGNMPFDQATNHSQLTPVIEPPDQENTVGFVTDEDRNYQNSFLEHRAPEPLLAQTSQFHPVRKSGAHSSLAEVLTDSLNTKSEEKKFHSNSNDEYYSRSPSFYKMDTSENEIEMIDNNNNKGTTNKDREDFYNDFVPSSSFASGAQAQIAYADSKRNLSNPGKQGGSSSHYRGESFGNCLPLGSGHTSSQRDSISCGKTGDEESPQKQQLSLLKIQNLSLQQQQILELQSEAEDSARGERHEKFKAGNKTVNEEMPAERIMMIEDEYASCGGSSSSRKETSHHLQSREKDEEVRQITSVLSKTDSLRDLKVFFSRENTTANLDASAARGGAVGAAAFANRDRIEESDQSGSENAEEQQHQAQKKRNKVMVTNKTIAEENLSDVSPERPTQRTSLLKISKKTSECRSRRDSVEIELLKHLIHREGRESQIESQKIVLVQKQKLSNHVGHDHKRISLQQEEKSQSMSGMRNLKFEDFSDESEVLAASANGPPASVNQSDYSHLKNLLDKFQKSPKNNSSCEIEEVTTLRQQVAQLQEKNQKLKADLQRAELKAQTLEVGKNKAVALAERLEAKTQIAEEQLNNEQQSSRHITNKYKVLKQEFRKMKQKYESELTTCVEEMENLRVIVTDVVSTQSQSDHKQMLSSSSRLKEKQERGRRQTASVNNNNHIVKSSTGESALTPMQTTSEHVQSQKVLGLHNSSSIRKRSIKAHPEETTSSESPVRPLSIAPLVKKTSLRRSNRFSSHEQFSLNSSQAQTARFSVDFTKSARVVSEYADGTSNGCKTTYRKDSASSSSLKRNNSRQILIRTFDGSDRSTSIGRRSNKDQRSQSNTAATIKECSEEDFQSVLKSNKRTVDLVKQTFTTGSASALKQRQQRQNQTQSLQAMLTNLYQQSRKSAAPTNPTSAPTFKATETTTTQSVSSKSNNNLGATSSLSRVKDFAKTTSALAQQSQKLNQAGADTRKKKQTVVMRRYMC